MPAKYSIKNYVENGYYHVYNRGVEKRLIFQDDQDYGVFLSYLKNYLSPKDEKELRSKLLETKISLKERDKIWQQIRMKNFNHEISLLAYCLMPNHFHFLIQQKTIDAIDKLMSSLSSRYARYFNQKYNRVGALFQGVYRAVSISNDAQFLHLSRYIHQQALQGDTQQGIQPSSYPEYLGIRNTIWIHPEEILTFFSKFNPSLSYENYVKEDEDFNSLEDLTLETPSQDATQQGVS